MRNASKRQPLSNQKVLLQELDKRIFIAFAAEAVTVIICYRYHPAAAAGLGTGAFEAFKAAEE